MAEFFRNCLNEKSLMAGTRCTGGQAGRRLAEVDELRIGERVSSCTSEPTAPDRIQVDNLMLVRMQPVHRLRLERLECNQRPAHKRWELHTKELPHSRRTSRMLGPENCSDDCS